MAFSDFFQKISDVHFLFQSPLSYLVNVAGEAVVVCELRISDGDGAIDDGCNAGGALILFFGRERPLPHHYFDILGFAHSKTKVC